MNGRVCINCGVAEHNKNFACLPPDKDKDGTVITTYSHTFIERK